MHQITGDTFRRCHNPDCLSYGERTYLCPNAGHDCAYPVCKNCGIYIVEKKGDYCKACKRRACDNCGISTEELTSIANGISLCNECLASQVCKECGEVLTEKDKSSARTLCESCYLAYKYSHLKDDELYCENCGILLAPIRAVKKRFCEKCEQTFTCKKCKKEFVPKTSVLQSLCVNCSPHCKKCGRPSIYPEILVHGYCLNCRVNVH